MSCLVTFHYRSYGTFFLQSKRLHNLHRGFTHYRNYRAELFDKYRKQLKDKKIMPAVFAELQGDFLYMLTTPSREEMEQMIEDFGKKA